VEHDDAAERGLRRLEYRVGQAVVDAFAVGWLSVDDAHGVA
jgi:hypothetical protein